MGVKLGSVFRFENLVKNRRLNDCNTVINVEVSHPGILGPGLEGSAELRAWPYR